jgi:hypothetical protein
MRIAGWTRQFVIVATSAAVLIGVGVSAWTMRTLRLKVELGPGARFSVSLSEPYIPPVSLPNLPYIVDDIKYLKLDDPDHIKPVDGEIPTAKSLSR